jgi:RNA polymerase sigma-70 factor (ECF subfamily)
MSRIWTDKELIETCLKDNPIAQKMLYDTYSSVLFGICLRYSKNEEEAQDILQDSFIKIFTKLDTYQFTGSFEGWLKRIVTNTSIEYYRKKISMEHLEEIGFNPYLAVDSDRGLEVEELLKMIQELPEGYRMVFNMYAIDGYTHSEIATKLNISEGTSKSQLSRARAYLQRKFKEKFELPRKSVQPLEHFLRLLR